MERNIGAIERALSMAAGAALVAYAMSGSRRTKALNVTAAAGAGLVGRGLSGYCPVSAAVGRNKSDTRVALAGRRGIRVRERVRINRSPHDVFAFWRTLSNLPQFMDHLVEVRVIDSTRSRWTAKAPGATTVSWDAEIISEIDGELIGWRSTKNADVATAGSVRFVPAPGGGTDVLVTLQYNPPAGALGSWVAWLFGQEPSKHIRADLEKLKGLLESGYVSASVWDVPMTSDVPGRELS
jgi:uncharacterized membrane protein